MSELKLNLPFFLKGEVNTLQFFQFPKILFTEPRLKDLSNDCKILYALMLDRVPLSMKNEWLDEEERVYIIYTNEEACKYLNKSPRTITKMMGDLDTEKGFGLIERKKQGLGKPDLIYVKSLLTLVEESSEKSSKKGTTVEKLSTKSGDLSTASTKNAVDNYVDNNLALQNVPLQSGNSCSSTVEKVACLDKQEFTAIKTDRTNTDQNQTEGLKPILPPNPSPTYPQQEETREDGWRDLPKTEKYHLVKSDLETAYARGEDGLYCLLSNFRSNRSKMETLVDILLDMETRERHCSHYDETSPLKFGFRATQLYASALTDMLTSEKMIKTKDQYINYSRLFDKLIPHISHDTDEGIRLDSVVHCTVMAYREANKLSQIKFPFPYMKSCIWTVLNEGNIRTTADYQYRYG